MYFGRVLVNAVSCPFPELSLRKDKIIDWEIGTAPFRICNKKKPNIAS